jgi:hypothetical protein
MTRIPRNTPSKEIKLAEIRATLRLYGATSYTNGKEKSISYGKKGVAEHKIRCQEKYLFRRALQRILKWHNKWVEEEIRKYTNWLMKHGYCDTDIIEEGGLEEYISLTKTQTKESSNLDRRQG